MYKYIYIYIYIYQGLIQAALDIGIPILRTLIWASPNSVLLSKTETTVKRNSSFFPIKSATSCDRNSEKINNKCIV